jgi:hypothetical protein
LDVLCMSAGFGVPPSSRDPRQGRRARKFGAGRGWRVRSMHIEILKDVVEGFRVRVVDRDGLTLRTFMYPTIESARKAARAWTVAYGNCPIHDMSGEPP